MRYFFLFLFALTASATAQESVSLWGRWDQAFTAEADPQTAFTVTLTGPAGAPRSVDGFWDGGSTWRVRFMPDAIGTWAYETASDAEALDGQTGTFAVVADEATTNPLYTHGAVQVADTGTYFEHADGTPFFWLGDTAWNGALRSDAESWDIYLADRVGKNFTGIQVVMTQWRAAYGDAEGQTAYTSEGDNLEINPVFFQRLDARLDAINEVGLLAAPVVLWGLGDPDEVPVPGRLPVDQAVRLARYIVARYQGHHVFWFLGGDDNYERERDRWLEVGRRVFDYPHHAPVTLHPQGMQWHFDPFLNEDWLDVLIYQSGHGDGEDNLRWIHSGPPAEKWQTANRPVINSEPPYEDHVAYQSREPHPAYNVRRASYWSLLNAPTAGVSYGVHGIWSWETEPAVPLNHDQSGTAKPWNEAMNLPGSADMGHQAELFTSLDWWELRPDQALLASQPGGDDPARFVTAARTEDGDTAVLYLPVGGAVTLVPDDLQEGLSATWFNPRDGSETPVESTESNTYTAPDDQDWVLVLQ